MQRHSLRWLISGRLRPLTAAKICGSSPPAVSGVAKKRIESRNPMLLLWVNFFSAAAANVTAAEPANGSMSRLYRSAGTWLRIATASLRLLPWYGIWMRNGKSQSWPRSSALTIHKVIFAKKRQNANRERPYGPYRGLIPLPTVRGTLAGAWVRPKLARHSQVPGKVSGIGLPSCPKIREWASTPEFDPAPAEARESRCRAWSDTNRPPSRSNPHGRWRGRAPCCASDTW